jgi:hypothetical protein
LWQIDHDLNCRKLPEAYLLYLLKLRTAGLDSRRKAKVLQELDETNAFVERLCAIKSGAVDPAKTLPSYLDSSNRKIHVLEVGKWRVEYYLDETLHTGVGTCVHNVTFPIV